jgi:prolyl oligopeptidase
MFPARIALAALACAAFSAAAQLPVFPAKNVPETFFGTVVDDPYRALEDTKNPEVAAWMKAHADHARKTLDSLPGYAALKARVVELDDAVEARIGSVRRLKAGDIFFTRRGAKDNTFKVYHRTPAGKETLLVDPDDWQKETGKPHAVNYFVPSPDAKLLAFGVSASGSEDASIYVIEVATKKRLGKPITRTQYPDISWHPDSQSFYYGRQQKMEAGMPATERYQNNRAYLHKVGSDADKDDVLLLGPGSHPKVNVPRTDFPFVYAIPGSRHAIAGVVAGVQRELSLWTAPLDTVGKPDTPWTPICTQADKVTDFAVMGDDLYVVTHAKSPKRAILKLSLAKPDLAKAATAVAASEDVIFAIGAARDGLYFEARNGPVKGLKRLAWGAKQAAEVKLPLSGSADLLAASPDIDGVLVDLNTWTRAREIFAVDAAGKVTNTKLQPLGKFDAPEGLVATEVRVKSHDGAMVPLSIIHKKGLKLDGSNPALLYGYGSYGITEDPGFGAQRLAWLEKGGVFAVANVRGTAVYGEDWYKAGFKTTKHNTWKDFIACAEYLVAQKYTSAKKLGILGGSAGGITVGRAMTERPDLFAAVIPAVGALDMVRAEATANGVPNIPEFGTVKKEDEFRGLLAMSSYHHVKDKTAYPAVMLTHGVNDPRVDVWHSTKMGARLMAATTSGKPILVNLDYDSGHGIGNTKQQRQRDIADRYAFLFWQAGHPEFQPKK